MTWHITLEQLSAMSKANWLRPEFLAAQKAARMKGPIDDLPMTDRQMIDVRAARKRTDAKAPRFSDFQVRQIRKHALVKTYGELAKKYGVSHPTISNIMRRKTYRHVE